MAILPTTGRNIANYARKIIGEKLIHERRGWENMKASKTDADVRLLGDSYITNYRLLMINITSVDLLLVDAVNVNSGNLGLDDATTNIVDALSRYLLIELTSMELTELLESLAKSVVQWNIAAGGNVLVTNTEGVWINAMTSDDVSTAQSLLVSALESDINYLTLILLADLHHLTYVANADQCLEILSSI